MSQMMEKNYLLLSVVPFEKSLNFMISNLETQKAADSGPLFFICH